ncbi:MAG TPA: hypothetical protein VFN39_11280, partial [Gemmatimonadaceae bacterium]|nr:hypothetical protein [Gemmatimonadaceae bacterium]
MLNDSSASAIRAEVTEERLFLDVSVLLAAALEPASPSHQCVDMSDTGTIVVSEHVESMARQVLLRNAPDLLPVFNDGLLRLASRSNLERVGTSPRTLLPSWASRLSGEDQQVLADALGSDASILLTHDAAFFQGPANDMAVLSPASYVWRAMG